MSDFGKWFEAAEHAAARIILEANAAQPDSAPALERTDFSSPSNEGGVASGAGVDLESAKEYLRSGFATIGGVYLAPKSAGALLAHIEALERDAARKEAKP